MGKKDGEEKLSKEEKAAKKAAKAAKRAAAEEAEAAPPSKKVKETDAEETPKKLSKEEKAAKKAAKAAKKEGKESGDADQDAKKEKKEKKEKTKRDGGDDDKAAKKAKKEAKEEPAAAAAPAGEEGETRVYVGNLPFKMTDEWMQEEFQEAGTITKFEWLTHADTGRFKGSGFLTFATKAEAEKAVPLNGKELEGRPMKVEIATPRKAAPPGGLAGSGEVGEPSASIFCGNLSWSVTEEALRDAFKDCGAISNIKWVEKDGEFKGFCFIDFESVDAATKAVALADTNVAGRPMRINFSKSKPAGDRPAGGGGWKEKPGGGGGRTERPYKPQNPKPDGCLELFCGNLPWSIDEAKITEFFGKAGATVTSTRWLNDKETGEFKGIGFVAFGDTADVDKAVSLGGENLDGRPIRLDYAGQKKEAKGAWQGGW